MAIYTASIHENTEPTFSSKRQWVPRRPPNFAFFGGGGWDGKKNFGTTVSTPSLSQKNLHQVSASARWPWLEHHGWMYYFLSDVIHWCKLAHYIQSVSRIIIVAKTRKIWGRACERSVRGAEKGAQRAQNRDQKFLVTTRPFPFLPLPSLSSLSLPLLIPFLALLPSCRWSRNELKS